MLDQGVNILIKLDMRMKKEISLRIVQGYEVSSQIISQIEFNGRYRKELIPYLRRLCIEKMFEEFSKDFFDIKVKKNKAKNFTYIELHTENIIMTVNFVSNSNKLPRKSLFRNELSESLNYDLFSFEDLNLNKYKNERYIHVVHSGNNKLERLYLVLPDKTNLKPLLIENLDIKKSVNKDVEEIKDIINIKIKDELNGKAQTS